MIVCLGLTPALQRTLLLSSLRTGSVNRVAKVILSAGGKAPNTAKAVTALGAEATVTGFNGGYNGECVERSLAELGIITAFTRIPAETRICTTLIDQNRGSVTELVEEAPPTSMEETARFIRDNSALIKKCRLLVICGTLPPSAADDFYRHFTKEAGKHTIPVIIDSQQTGVLSVLPGRPLLVKMNRAELQRTMNISITDESLIAEQMRLLIRRGAQNVLITQGKDHALLMEGKKLTRITPPSIEKEINPVGSGDCTSAGIAVSLLKGYSLSEAVSFGIASGSANAERCIPADISKARVMELLNDYRQRC